MVKVVNFLRQSVNLVWNRYEQQNYGDLKPEELTEKFRLAWSV